MDDVLKLLLEIKENMVTKEELKKLPAREDFVDLKVEIQDLKNRVASIEGKVSNIENKMVTHDEFVNGLNEVYQGIETITMKVSEKLEEHEEKIEELVLSTAKLSTLDNLLKRLRKDKDDDQPESQV